MGSFLNLFVCLFVQVIVQQEAFWLPELLNFLGLSVTEQRPFTEAHKEAIKRSASHSASTTPAHTHMLQV